MAKNVRLSDIADKLNVSTVTVSKALSGQKGVSDELRERIIELADKMGYTKTERTETEHKSYTIGVIVADRYLKENQSFYWKIYQEISRKAISVNCFPLLEVISHDAEEKCELPRVITEKKVDGLIIMGAFHKQYADYLIKEVEEPLINLDTTTGWENCDCVVVNNLLGGYQMTNYLFELGHDKIGFVGTRLATSSIDDRFLGYCKSLMEHGIELRKDWVLDDRDREFGVVESKTKFILPDEMPTAFFCNCDLSASLLIKKLEEHGYKVPQDVSVVGFDNYVADQFSHVGITTYEIDTVDMAKKAVHIIVHKIKNEAYTAGVYTLAGKVIERNSAMRTAPPVPFA